MQAAALHCQKVKDLHCVTEIVSRRYPDVLLFQARSSAFDLDLDPHAVISQRRIIPSINEVRIKYANIGTHNQKLKIKTTPFRLRCNDKNK